MMTFVAVIHILVAILLIGLVLIQDSKGGGALGIGGGGSNSLLGATGAQTLAARLTRWVAVIFAGTCITLTVMTVKSNKSVLDSGTLPAAAAPAPETTPAAGAAPVETQAPAAPAATPEATPEKK